MCNDQFDLIIFQINIPIIQFSEAVNPYAP